LLDMMPSKAVARIAPVIIERNTRLKI